MIFDDSVLQKKGKYIERLSRVWDHVTGRCVMGYKLLAGIYWDGASCIPVDFSLHRDKGKKKGTPYGLKKKVMKKQFRKHWDHLSGGYQRAKEKVILYTLGERLWGLFLELVKIIEVLFEVGDSDEIIRRLLENEKA